VNLTGPGLRYYRFHILGVQDDGSGSTTFGAPWANIYELELRTTVGGVDITTPATSVTASNTYFIENGGPTKAVDNNANIGSSPFGWDSGIVTFPVDLVIDLGAGGAKTVVEYTLTNRALAGYGPARSPASWLFQGSNDGMSWTTIDSRTGINDWTAGETKVFGPPFTL
jgi:hypothetical protein